MIQELNRLLRRGTRWFLRNHNIALEISQTVKAYAPGVKTVQDNLRNYVSGTMRDSMDKFVNNFKEVGVPEELAFQFGGLSAMFSSLDIVAASRSINCPVDKVTQVYYKVGSRLKLGWFREQIKLHPVSDHWDAMARAAFRDDIDRQQRSLTASILCMDCGDASAESRINYWLEKNQVLAKRWMDLIAELRASAQPEFIMFAVALRELLDLTRAAELNIGAYSASGSNNNGLQAAG